MRDSPQVQQSLVAAPQQPIVDSMLIPQVPRPSQEELFIQPGTTSTLQLEREAKWWKKTGAAKDTPAQGATQYFRVVCSKRKTLGILCKATWSGRETFDGKNWIRVSNIKLQCFFHSHALT
jgi:hypothetical protein